jgi:SpoIID/LytB domain protein
MRTAPRSTLPAAWRRLMVATTVVGLVGVASPAVAAGGTVTFTGGGWGHSVGMSQYGAEGMARSGFSYDQILRHYYQGVQVAPVAGIPDLRVGIAQNAASGIVSATGGSVEVRHTDGTPVATAYAGNFVTIAPLDVASCTLTITGQTPIQPVACNLNVVGLEPGSMIVAGTRTVNHGFVYIRRVAGGFHVGAQMDLEEYLRGIAEIPNSWREATQQAQAVAARSYAIATTAERRANSGFWNELCFCDLRSGPVDQNWEAYASEAVRPNFVTGVNSTGGQAIVRPASPATALKAFYSSSTFGETESNATGFGGTPLDYLQSVDDSWAVDGTVSNPLATWERTFDISVVAGRLGFDTISAISPIETSPDTGVITRLQFVGTKNGAPLTKSYLTRELRTSSLLGSTSLGCVGNSTSASCFPSLQVTGVTLRFIGEQAAIHDPTTGKWYLRNDSGSVTEFFYGNPGDTAFVGDWDCDGVKTPGLYRRSTGYVYLRNSNTQGNADVTYYFGNPNDVPIAGDFNGNGCDTVSIYRPSEGRFYVINRLGSADQGLGGADYSYLFGNTGDVPIVGDWDGDGIDTAGLRRNSNGFVYLRNTNTTGIADVSFFYGNTGDLVFSGDFDDDGVDSVGLFRPSNFTVYLRNALSTGTADWSYIIGNSTMKPAGAWAG